jgi:hypothetical protein
MKKVKIMLASTAILAVVAGAFAFKAKQAFSFDIYTTNAATYVAKQCTLTAVSTASVDPHFASTYYTLEPGACLSFRTYYTTE